MFSWSSGVCTVTIVSLQCVQRTLEQLVADGKLVEKVYGKQKVYVIDQVQCTHSTTSFVHVYMYIYYTCTYINVLVQNILCPWDLCEPEAPV